MRFFNNEHYKIILTLHLSPNKATFLTKEMLNLHLSIRIPCKLIRNQC
jgi:hypothetical protein